MPPKKGRFQQPPAHQRGRPAPEVEVVEPAEPPPPLPTPDAGQCCLRLLTFWAAALRVVHIAVAVWFVGFSVFPQLAVESLGDAPDYVVSDRSEWCSQLTGGGDCGDVPVAVNTRGRSCVDFGDANFWKQTSNVSCGGVWCCFGRNNFGYIEGATSDLTAECSSFVELSAMVETERRMELTEPATLQPVLYLRCRQSGLAQTFSTLLRAAFFTELARQLYVLWLCRRMFTRLARLDPEAEPVTAAAPAHFCTTPLFAAVAVAFPPLLCDYVLRGTLSGPCSWPLLQRCFSPGRLPPRGAEAWKPVGSPSWTAYRVVVFVCVELLWAAASVALIVMVLKHAPADALALQCIFAVTAVAWMVYSLAPVCRRRERLAREDVAAEPLLKPEDRPDPHGPAGHAGVAAAVAAVVAAACPIRRPQHVYDGPATDAMPRRNSGSPPNPRGSPFGRFGTRPGARAGVFDITSTKPGRQNSGIEEL